MSGKRQPAFRITRKRKDGEEITFTNFKDERVSKLHAPLGVLWPRDNGQGYDLTIDPASVGHKLDPAQFFYNVYPTERDGDAAPRGKPPQKSGKSKADPLSFD